VCAGEGRVRNVCEAAASSMQPEHCPQNRQKGPRLRGTATNPAAAPAPPPAPGQ
jgi:hypothetical protein